MPLYGLFKQGIQPVRKDMADLTSMLIKAEDTIFLQLVLAFEIVSV